MRFFFGFKCKLFPDFPELSVNRAACGFLAHMDNSGFARSLFPTCSTEGMKSQKSSLQVIIQQDKKSVIRSWLSERINENILYVQNEF